MHIHIVVVNMTHMAYKNRSSRQKVGVVARIDGGKFTSHSVESEPHISDITSSSERSLASHEVNVDGRRSSMHTHRIIYVTISVPISHVL